jgi:hypothetical protein
MIGGLGKAGKVLQHNGPSLVDQNPKIDIIPRYLKEMWDCNFKVSSSN